MKRPLKKSKMQLLAERLRAARSAAGFSQSEVAEKLNKPQSFVSRCESGTRRLDVFELEEFAQLYKKRIDYFIGELNA